LKTTVAYQLIASNEGKGEIMATATQSFLIRGLDPEKPIGASREFADTPRQNIACQEQEAVLVLATKGGNGHAFEILIERYQRRIPAIAWRFLHDGHPYSMPPEAISMPATLYLYADRVRIVAGRYEVNHPRKFVAHEGTTLAAHRAALVAAVSGKRGKRYLKRQQLLELGEPAFRYLTEIVHRRPGQWFHDVDRLHDILQSHGAEALRHAMEQGLQEQVFGATYIERFLQRPLVFEEVIS